MHLDHRIGSLEKGKDADFVVLSGAPFSLYTHVKQTWIDGKKVFDESTDRAYRDGGFMLATGEKLPVIRKVAEEKFQRSPSGRGQVFDGARRKSLVAVMAEKLHTGYDVFESGLVVIEDGKVVYVGDQLRRIRRTCRSYKAKRCHPRPHRPLLRRGSDRRLEHPGRPGPGRTLRPEPG